VSVSVKCKFTQDSWKIYRLVLREVSVYCLRTYWQGIFQNMARRVQSCLEANGGHFQRMLWCHISHITNVLLFKFRCNIIIGVRIIKEMSGLVGSGTSCIYVLCMYVCMYVHMNVYMWVYMYVCMYVCMCVGMYYVCMYVCMHACTYIWTYIRVCMCVCLLCMDVHVCMYVCIYLCMYIRIYVRM
jgi:hypothetical protein